MKSGDLFRYMTREMSGREHSRHSDSLGLWMQRGVPMSHVDYKNW